MSTAPAFVQCKRGRGSSACCKAVVACRLAGAGTTVVSVQPVLWAGGRTAAQSEE